MQRYIVFLNDRAVTISQNINKPAKGSTEMIVDFIDQTSIAKAYNSFYHNTDCINLQIRTGKNFHEACDIFNSLFTRIEAAGGIVRNQKGKSLFIKRLGVWDLPKGKLHKGEPIRDGALREVSEETGLTALRITKQLPSTYHIYTDRKGKQVLKETFWFEMICEEDQKLIPQTEEDITEVKWFSDKDLHEPLQNTYASLRTLLESYYYF